MTKQLELAEHIKRGKRGISKTDGRGLSFDLAQEVPAPAAKLPRERSSQIVVHLLYIIFYASQAVLAALHH